MGKLSRTAAWVREVQASIIQEDRMPREQAGPRYGGLHGYFALLKLPETVLETILGKLLPTELLVLRTVCKELHRFSGKDWLWRAHQDSLVKDLSMDGLMTFKKLPMLEGSLGSQVFEEQRRGFLQQLRDDESQLTKGQSSKELGLYFMLLGTDKMLHFCKTNMYSKPEYGGPYITLMFQLVLRTSEMWHFYCRSHSPSINVEDLTYPAGFEGLTVPNGFENEHDRQAFCRAFYSAIYYICGIIYSTIYAKLDDSLCVWSEVVVWWGRLAYFLTKLAEEPFAGKTVTDIITSVNEQQRSTYKSVHLLTLGTIAFRSKVLLGYGLKRRLVQQFQDEELKENSQQGPISMSTEDKRIFLGPFLVPDYPRPWHGKLVPSLKGFRRAYQHL